MEKVIRIVIYSLLAIIQSLKLYYLYYSFHEMLPQGAFIFTPASSRIIMLDVTIWLIPNSIAFSAKTSSEPLLDAIITLIQ